MNGPVITDWSTPHNIGSYSSGILSQTEQGDFAAHPNHASVILGWGQRQSGQSDAGMNYWIIRNSAGEMWGMKGDALIKRGTNMHGIETYIVAFEPEFY